MSRHTLKLLDDRLAQGKPTLTSHEVRHELGLSPQAASNLLTRWRRAGLVDQVSRGRYAIRLIGALGTRASSEDVALAVAALVGQHSHRIAYHSALDFHGLLMRPVRRVQIASPRSYASATISGRPLQVVHEREATVAIGIEAAGFGAVVSSLERSLLDAASRPDLVGGYLPLAEGLTGCDPDLNELFGLAKQLNAAASLRRIGSLVDQLWPGKRTQRLEPLKPPTSDLDLDPGLKDLGTAFRDGKWRIRWPVNPDAVRLELEN